MFKLVVLSAIFAAVVAKPGAVLSPFGYSAPIAYSSPLLTPATTTFTQHALPAPFVYSAPYSYAHYIKKRSAQFSYISPSTYIANTHLTAPLPAYTTPLGYSSPALVHSAPFLPAAHLPYAHLIKKRSALLPAPFTYAAGAPLLTSTYAAAPVVSAPLVHSTPLIHSAPLYSQPIITPHFIKKRSAALAYLAPTAYSHQSRVDITHSSPLISTTYTAPISYHNPIAYTHVL